MEWDLKQINAKMTGINVIFPVNSTNSDNVSAPSINYRNETEVSEIHLEKENALENSKNRILAFHGVLRCNYNSTKAYWHLFTGFIGIFLSLGLASIYTLVPWNDAIKNPQYFYESLILYSMSLSLILAAQWTILFCYSTNIKRMKTFRFFLKLWSVQVVTSIFVFSILSCIWMYVLNFQSPMPFNGYLLFFNSVLSIVLTLWFELPIEWRQEPNFRKRFKYFLISCGHGSWHIIIYGVITGGLQKVPEAYQWIATIFLPLVREFNVWLTMKIQTQSANGDIDSTRIYFTTEFGISHANFLAITVGNTATLASSLVIIGIEFLINIFTCLRIIYFKNKEETSETNEKIIELIQLLIITEWIEIIVPIGSLLCIILGYFGPNKDLIGDIGSSFWQFKAIKDIETTIKILGSFFAVDLISLLVTTVLLWKFCKVNLYEGYLILKKEFWLPFAISLSVNLTGVSIRDIWGEGVFIESLSIC